MLTPDELKILAEKLAVDTATVEEIENICQAFEVNDRSIILQFAQTINNVNQVKDSQFGNIISQGADVESIKQFLQEKLKTLRIVNALNLDNEWFANQLNDAAKTAEPRYTPELTVDVPISITFEALGRTPQWQTTVQNLITKVSDAIKQWSHGISKSSPDPATPEFPVPSRESAESLTKTLSEIRNYLNHFLITEHEVTLINNLKNLVNQAFELAEECLSTAIEDVEEKHGKGMAESAGFRQFMAEYQLSFPAQHIDSARDVIKVLEELRNWLNEPTAILPMSVGMLLVGSAGIGKTHAICDIALDRQKRGLRSIVLLGEQFTQGDLWQQIRQILGISAAISRDELLAALNAISQSTNYLLIIFIDALNETRPRDTWYTNLASLIEQISRYPWLRLCISCRSTYLEDVIAPNINLPIVEHKGFEGVEFDACFDFFRFYELEPPSMPLMQPEFFNPLFLRLVCESLKDAGVRILPDGMLGISEVIQYLLDSKNKKLARILDYYPKEKCLQKALNSLVSAMSAIETTWLPWEQAKELVDLIKPSVQRSSSLFDQMIREGIISEDRVVTSSQKNPQDVIRFSFERFADQLLAEKYLEEISEDSLHLAFASGGLLNFSVVDEAALRKNHGLLEALAIQIPEKYGVELTEVVSFASYPTEITLIVIESLTWRAITSFTETTALIVEQALHHKQTFASTMEALFALSTRTGHPLNSVWFHNFFASISMPVRDAALCPYFYGTYGKLKGVDRLLRWALKANLGSVSDETAELWVIQLSWLCVASDRRVRDYATKAMVRIMEDHPLQWPFIIRRFSQIDDEYVIERCLAAAYGSLIIANNNHAIKAASVTVYEIFFSNKNPPQNAIVRDYARLILELANHRNQLPDDIKPEQFRPPYESEWPLNYPEKNWIEKYSDSSKELPKLYDSCMEDDFAVYTVTSALDKYKHIQINQAQSWIFKHILDMGYTSDLFARFDGHILYKFGGGRAKPSWAERIGKKYQWIALYRLIARASDHLEIKRSQWDSPPSIPELQALDERNIDPTVLLPKTQTTKCNSWWIPVKYDLKQDTNLSDAEWLDSNDFPNSSAMLTVVNPNNGKNWLILESYPEWNSKQKNQDFEDGYPYRMCWMQIRSYLVPKNEAENGWTWLCEQHFMGGWMPEGHSLSQGFLGEYPWGIPFIQYFEQYGSARIRDSEIPFSTVPTANSILFERDFDAYQEDSFSVLVPATIFFESDDLQWDSISGYKSISGNLCFNDPSILEPGNSTLLVDKEYIEEFMKKNDLALIWTVLAEKHCVEGFASRSNLGITEYSQVHLLINGEIKSSEGIINRVIPSS